MNLSNDERGLLRDLSLERISYDELLLQYPSLSNKKYILSIFEYSAKIKDENLLEYVISLFYSSGFVQSSCEYFCDILTQDWHKQHEEIVRIFQFKLNCQCSISSIEKALSFKYEYLELTGDYNSFVIKCMYAIASLKNTCSKNSLNKLSQSPVAEIRQAAEFQLKRIE